MVEETVTTGGDAVNVQEDAVGGLPPVGEVVLDDSQSGTSFNGFNSDLSPELQNSQKIDEAVSEAEAGELFRRKREGDSPGDQGRDKRLKGAHPELGYKIIVETITGKQEYTVKSKKNVKKLSDCFYFLQNSENKVRAYDLKDVDWEYMVEGEVFEPGDKS